MQFLKDKALPSGIWVKGMLLAELSGEGKGLDSYDRRQKRKPLTHGHSSHWQLVPEHFSPP